MKLAVLALVTAVMMPAVIGRARAETCAIKGNISRKGVRVYHLPSSPAYAATTITERRGERWFCSAEEAKAAGWRPAKVQEAPERSRPVQNPFQ